MSLRYRILGLTVVAFCSAAACGGSKKIAVGDACTLNSDCKSPLTCSMGKCHEGCRASTDCQPGQTCTKVNGVGVCQLPAEAECKEQQCGELLICAPDLHCRSACQVAATDCMGGQVCVQSVCAEKSDLDMTTGQLPQKIIPDGGFDAQSTARQPEAGAGNRDTAASPDLAPPSPDLALLLPDTAVLSPDTAIMSFLPDAPPFYAEAGVPSFIDAPLASFDALVNTEVSWPDVPYSGLCGIMIGTACCAGETCTAPGTACLGNPSNPDVPKTCQLCGTTGNPCCPGDTCTDNTACKLMGIDGGTSKMCQGCGKWGQTCCAGDTCTQSDTVCAVQAGGSKTCLPCGSPGSPCCPGDTCTDSNSECKLVVSDGGTNKMCQGCGGWGQACCAGDTCTQSNTICAAQAGGGKTCQTCGSYGSLCCPGDRCDAVGAIASTCQPMSDGSKMCRQCGYKDEACCAGDTCQDTNTECMLSPDGGATGGTVPTDAGITVVGKICRQCGGAGQPCCSGAGKDKCQDNMALCESGVCCGAYNGPCCAGDLCTDSRQVCTLWTPSATGTSKTCQSCGNPGSPCCAGDTCSNSAAVCLLTTHMCTECGGQNQPCCQGGTCGNASYTCSADICTCTPPPVPVVTATPGNGKVVLTWPAPPTPDSGTLNVVFYDINRSVTSGSRYTPLEHVTYDGTASPSYTDSTVTNGITYYYTISTRGSDNCKATDSAEVSAKPHL